MEEPAKLLVELGERSRFRLVDREVRGLQRGLDAERPARGDLLGQPDPRCQRLGRAPDGPRRLFRHAADGGQVDRCGRCDACGSQVPAADTIVAPGPGLEPPAEDDSWVTTALTRPHRLLEPLRAAAAAAVP